MALDPVAYQPYADPDDFIREVTDHIWVDRAIGHIRENYEPDSIVHGSLGTAVGVEEVVQGTLMRIADTPDRVGQAEDVVWEQRGDDAFLSSHLVLSIDPHTGFRSRTIASCLYRRGRMVEEWVGRDGLAIALQTGQHPDDLARVKKFRGFTGSMTRPPLPDITREGDSGPRPDDFRPEVEMVLEFLERVWNQRELEQVQGFWERDLVLHDIGDRTVIRPEGYRRSLLTLLRRFPAATFQWRDVQTHHDERYAGLRVAVTWKMDGVYDGLPDYGPLTGSAVEVLGVSQFLVQRGRLVREVRLYDDLAIRTQILSARGDTAYDSPNIY